MIIIRDERSSPPDKARAFASKVPPTAPQSSAAYPPLAATYFRLITHAADRHPGDCVKCFGAEEDGPEASNPSSTLAPVTAHDILAAVLCPNLALLPPANSADRKARLIGSIVLFLLNLPPCPRCICIPASVFEAGVIIIPGRRKPSVLQINNVLRSLTSELRQLWAVGVSFPTVLFPEGHLI